MTSLHGVSIRRKAKSIQTYVVCEKVTDFGHLEIVNKGIDFPTGKKYIEYGSLLFKFEI